MQRNSLQVTRVLTRLHVYIPGLQCIELFGLCLDALESLDLTMDENKENQTPEGVQGELDWVQQYSLDQEREEQELQQALAQSLQEHVRNLAVHSIFYEFNKIVIIVVLVLWT